MPSSTYRAVAAMKGLALGDAYGRPLEFLSGSSVHLHGVDTDVEMMWTDDTHMSLFLAEAIFETGRFALEDFAPAVGRAFVRWLNDPLMPSTAPGGTCLRGARSFAVSGDWKTSGDKNSDGCGAVMRVLPVAIAFRDEDEMIAAAIAQAMVTHAHPNAIEASVAGALLFRHVLDGNELTPYFVESVAKRFVTGGDRHAGGTVARSLFDAVRHFGMASSKAPFDDSKIWPNDGGWRSGSALGIAVACAMLWPDPTTAIEKAARINGDSDSTACLAGALTGAQFPDLVPKWSFFRQEEIEATARLLAIKGAEALRYSSRND